MITKTLLTGILGLCLGLGFTTPSWAAPAVVEKGTGYLAYEWEGDIDCLDEAVRETASITYNYHLVTTPNGDIVYNDLWFNLESTLVGVSSGTVWTLVKNVSPDVIRTTGGGSSLWTARTTYVSDAGQILEIRAQFQITYNANGELKIDRFEVRCWVRD